MEIASCEIPLLVSSLFWSMKMHKNSSTAMWNSKKFSGVTPPARPSAVRGRCATDHPYAAKLCPPQYSKQIDATAIWTKFKACLICSKCR